MEKSCGNVFADLNLPDADKLFARADLLAQIYNIIKKKKRACNARIRK